MKKTTEENARTYPAEKVRQGEIILKQPWQRVVFIAGFVAAFLLPFVVHYFAQG